MGDVFSGIAVVAVRRRERGIAACDVERRFEGVGKGVVDDADSIGREGEPQCAR